MAEEEAAGQAAKGGFGFLAKKAGPLPLGVWLVAGLGIWWWTRRGQSSSAGTTDPAGNVGTINPSTGYVYGSAADQAAQAAQSGGGSAGGSSSGSTVAGQYADNNAWSRAAINYLVGLGVDPTQANEAVQAFLSSAPLTSSQQADVNLAIQALGPPPTLPGPVGSGGKPIVSPPTGGSGTPGRTPAPGPVTGLAVAGRTSTSVSLKWNRAANATEYEIFYNTGPTAAASGAWGTKASSAYATVGSLKPGTTYTFKVRGINPDNPHNPAFAQLTTSTTK